MKAFYYPGKQAPPSISRTDFSGTQTSSSSTSALEILGFGVLSAQLEVTAASGTNPTIDVELQTSEDGTNWSPLYTFKRFTSTGSYRTPRIALGGQYYRFAWTIGGTTPSFTFNIKSTLKAYLTNGVSGLIRYSGVDLTAVNNVSEVFDARGNQNVALIAIRATDGGNGSKWRLQVSTDNLNWDDLTADIHQNQSVTITQNFSGQAFRFWRVKVVGQTNIGTRVLDLFWQSNGGS